MGAIRTGRAVLCAVGVLAIVAMAFGESRPGADLPGGIQAAATAASQAATKPAKVKGPGQFEGAIKKFEGLDKAHSPAAGGTLFVGSSSFTKWKDLETVFKDFHAINRGFGGSTFPDLLYFYDRVVLPYKPAKVVVFEGTNDANQKRTAEQIFGDAKMFAEKVRKDFPEAQVYFLPLVPAPVRVPVEQVMDDVNGRIQGYVKTDSHLHYIDIRNLLLDAGGNPDPKYYLKDQLHPNAEGYAKWIPVITAGLEGAATAPAK